MEININELTSDDLRWYMELVPKLHFLPLVIHSVALRLKATGESVSHFTRSSGEIPATDGTMNLYMGIIERLRSYDFVEALNLLKIISFFSQHIPVEMIVLGARLRFCPCTDQHSSIGVSSVDVPVKTSDSASGRSFNSTLKILNEYGLIDRNEHEADQSSNSGGDLFVDSVDVVRMHNVVQLCIIDYCRKEGQSLVWLHRAAALFCQSFSVALQPIKRTKNRGLVEDFRIFEIHGQKLLDHIQRLGNKKPTTSGWQLTVQRSLTTI
jgi:hypothetical protein